MLKIDEREILRRVQNLSQISPSESSTQRAVESARSRLMGAANARRSWWMRRIALPAGIAAALLIAFGIAWVSLTPRPVSAAEFLQQVAVANSAYQGWVHVRTERLQTATQPAGPTPHFAMHVNTVDNTFVVISGSDGKTSIRIDAPQRGEQIEYDSTRNEIRLGDMHPFNVKAVRRIVGLIPVDLSSELASFRQKTGGEPLRIEHRQEAGAERIDITYFDAPEEAKAVLERNWDLQCVPVRATLWADPGTRLIQRMTTRYMGRYEDGIRLNEPTTTVTTYGEPELTDVYAAGAPRDARVIDRRLQGEPRQIMDRLDRRHAEGLGNGVALLTQSYLNKDGMPSRDGSVVLHGYQSQARFFSEFHVNEHPGQNARNHMGVPQFLPFDGWPTPDVNEVLERLSPPQAAMFLVTDGWRAWGGQIWNQFQKPGPIKDDALRLWWDCTSPAALYASLWPCRRTLFLFDVGVQIEVLHDPQHPNRVGIHIRKLTDGRTSATAPECVSEERTHWMDTARNDVPIETVVRGFTTDGKQLDYETRWKFLSHALRSDGSWYPTLWRMTSTSFKDGQPTDSREEEYHLQFYPNLKVDPQWFADPTPWIDQAYQAARDASPHW